LTPELQLALLLNNEDDEDETAGNRHHCGHLEVAVLAQVDRIVSTALVHILVLVFVLVNR
jgi:hypothetical protein